MGKAIDICRLLSRRTEEFERQDLIGDLEKGRVLGYGLHESTLLVTLQEEDFEEIFHDKSGYLPTSVIYDKKTPSHTIRFDNGHKSLEKTGTARFIETPSCFIREFEGEAETRALSKAVVVSCREDKKEKTPATASDSPVPGRLQHGNIKSAKNSEDMKEKASGSAEPEGIHRRYLGLDTIKKEMHRWLYLYAFKHVLKEWAKGKTDGKKRTQAALVKAAQAKLKELGIQNSDFVVSDEFAKRLHREAIKDEHLPPLEEIFAKNNNKSQPPSLMESRLSMQRQCNVQVTINGVKCR